MSADATASAFLFSDYYTLILPRCFGGLPVDGSLSAEKKCAYRAESRSVA